MKGWRLHEWGGPLVWEDIEESIPGPQEVSIAVEACGVGLTVLNCISGDLADDPALLPRVPGHEIVGRVVSAGGEAGAGLVGRRVVAYFYLSCGECVECQAGFDARCRNLAGWVGIHTDGGYAPRVVLPARNAIPIPDSLDPVAATVIPDAVATPVHISRSRAGISTGDRVVVIGAGGGVGVHMIQVAMLDGAEAAGLDVDDEKLAMVADLGAQPVRSDDFGLVDPASLFEAGRPTVVVDLVGSDPSLAWSAEALATGGRLVILTTFRHRSLAVDPRDLVFREVSLVGSRYASRAEVAVAGGLVASGAIRPIVGQVAEPAEVHELHEGLAAGTMLGRGALDWSKHVE